MLVRYGATIAAAEFLGLSILEGTASANPISFTLTGTADNSLYGYVSGQSYSFTWVVNSGFTDNGSSWFIGDDNFWNEELVSESPIFTDVRGDGLSGSWQRPTGAEDDPYSNLRAFFDGDQRLSLYAGTDASGGSIGLLANGAAVSAVRGDVYMDSIFSFPGSYTDPNVYFGGLTGTYAPTAGGLAIYTVGGGPMSFTATSVTISAVPEPSTALLGVLGLVTPLALRRRNAR